MTAIRTVTDRITLVMLNISIWSGRKKLRPEDLNLIDGEIPPDDLVSLGSKRICDPEQLKAFHRIKQSAERACLRVGTRFIGGFAIPQDRAEAVARQLDTLKAEFDAETRTFLSDYDHALEDWIAKLPRFEAPIRRAVEPADVVGARLRFGYQLLQIQPAEQPGTLQEDVKQLGNGIFAETEQMARDLEASFEGKDKLHRRALGTFARIRDKLSCLSFIDPRIQPVVDTIDDWVSRLPKTGPIAGGLFNEGMGLALLLSDAERMARHGAGQLDSQEPWLPDDTQQGAPEPEDIRPQEGEGPEQLTLVDFDAEFGSLFTTDVEHEEAEEGEALGTLDAEHAQKRHEELSFFF